MDVDQQAFESVLWGAAKPETVCTAWQGCFADETAQNHDIQTLREIILRFMEDTGGQRILKSIACAVLNTDHARDGIQYLVDEKGEVGLVVTEDEAKRKFITDGLLNR